MNTTVKQLTDTKVHVTINVGAEALADAEKVALVKLSKSIKVPGFRKGKAPASVVTKHVDPQALQQQLLDDAISKAVAEAFLAENIQALERPSVEIKKYVPGDLLEFTAEAEVLPEVKLGNYKKLNVPVEKVSVKAVDVDDVIERMRQGFATKEEVSREAKLGDETLIDFIGKKDDIAFDGGTGSDYTLKLGSGQFIPGFEEGVAGHKAGESFDIPLAFPDDYHAKDLAGAKVVFTVTLKKVLESTPAEANDELAKKAGNFETLAALKEDIKREITEQKQKEASENHKDALVMALVEKSKVSAPELLVADQSRSIEQDFAQNLMYRGLDLTTYLQTNGFKDEADWREREVKPAAERRVKASLVLAEVAKAEKITVSDQEIHAKIDEYKKQYAGNAAALEQLNTPEVHQDVANQLVTIKTVEHIANLNK